MGINDFMMNYYGAYRNDAEQPPQQQTGNNSVALKMPRTRGASGGLGIIKPQPAQPGTGYGFEGTKVTQNPSLPGQFPASMLQYSLMNDKSTANQQFQQQQQAQQQQIAQQYSQMAVGQNNNTNQYGVQQSSPVQQSDYYNQQITNLGAISQTGENQLQAAQNAAQFQATQKAINANAGYNISYTGAPYNPSNLPAGSSSNSVAGQAIALAMTAMHNHVPYSWGGTDLNKGVDCSGLLFSIYNKLGIALPRTTYEQAKFGRRINGLQNAMPGDLIFYNTGSSDPNGIGVNSHVALYLGNGMVLEAANPQRGIVEEQIGDYNGLIMRPW